RGYDLIVAHFDHGIRHDSAVDRELVQWAARRYELPFVAEQGNLGRASEAGARAARYAFLVRAQDKHRAKGIVTGHHQDDLVETSLLNLARGAGRHGLAPMVDGEVLRPLLGLTRTE